jgi:hypothetical protein
LRCLRAATTPLLVLIIAFSSGSTPCAEPQWIPVPASAIAALFSEHELGDGVHYAYQFRRNGRYTGVEMGRDVRGKWRAHGGKFCWTPLEPSSAEECMTVRRRGKELQLLKDGEPIIEGTLSPLGATGGGPP